MYRAGGSKSDVVGQRQACSHGASVSLAHFPYAHAHAESSALFSAHFWRAHARTEKYGMVLEARLPVMLRSPPWSNEASLPKCAIFSLSSALSLYPNALRDSTGATHMHACMYLHLHVATRIAYMCTRYTRAFTRTCTYYLTASSLYTGRHQLATCTLTLFHSDTNVASASGIAQKSGVW